MRATIMNTPLCALIAQLVASVALNPNQFLAYKEAVRREYE